MSSHVVGSETLEKEGGSLECWGKPRSFEESMLREERETWTFLYLVDIQIAWLQCCGLETS